MTNSKYSNDQTTDIVARSQGFDEGYAAGIKEGISMALAVLPEIEYPIDYYEGDSDYKNGNQHGQYEHHNLVEAALLKLKKG